MSATETFTIELGEKTVTVDVQVQTIGASEPEPTAPDGFTEQGQLDLGILGTIYIYTRTTIA